MPLTASVLHDDGVALIALAGELDLEGLADVHAAVQQTLAQGLSHLVVDLSELRFCDSSGLGVLLRAARAARSAGGACVIAGASGAVARLFAITAMDQVVPLEPDVSSALAHARAQVDARPSAPS